MTASIITQTSLVSNLSYCLVSNWHTYAQSRINAGSTILDGYLPPLMLQELLSVIDTYYTYLTICDGVRGEDVLVHKENNKLVCQPLLNAYPKGSEIRACVSPVALVAILTPQNTNTNSM